MTHIQIKKGLNIPIEGEAVGALQELAKPKRIAFDFSHFVGTKFHLLVKPGDSVKIGQPLAEDKDVPGRFFVSPAGGVIADIRRGEKRALLAAVIDVAAHEEHIGFGTFDAKNVSRDELIQKLLQAGLFTHIRSRPFNRLAHPQKLPRAIFVKAVESAPFMPSAEMQVKGHEKEFAEGLNALQKLTDGPVHLIHRQGSDCKAFTEAENVYTHTVSGPHPAANVSVHIEKIDPIKKADDVIWTLTALDVVAIGHFLLHKKILTTRVVALAGTGFKEGKRQFVRARAGHSIEALIDNRCQNEPVRLISGDPLTGKQVHPEDFLGFSHTVVTAICDASSREFLSFFRLGAGKYTASGTYLSGHMNPAKHQWDFTTSQHGEERAFIDGSIYERVMPLRVLPLQLVRACMAEDYELAQEQGLLEIDSEDFALPEFVCPCKIPMMDIIHEALHAHAKDVLG